MGDDKGFGIVVVVIGCLCFVLGMIVGCWMMESCYQEDAIEHKAAQYNPVTGDFEWIEVTE